MGKYQKNIEAARRISVMQYLQTYHPGELVRQNGPRSIAPRRTAALLSRPQMGCFTGFRRARVATMHSTIW